jgi:predicted DNA-binding transcriptional regulator YafY
MSAATRILALLSLVPRAPRSTTADDLAETLDLFGHRAHRRSVQRDLVTLRHFGHVVADETAKPFRWSRVTPDETGT